MTSCVIKKIWCSVTKNSYDSSCVEYKMSIKCTTAKFPMTMFYSGIETGDIKMLWS